MMTHDDLALKVYQIYKYNDADEENGTANWNDVDNALLALHSIIYLHKPIKDEWFKVGEMICEECTREEYTQKYPCLTIQIIQKEVA